jgi:hypothetical protein
MSRQTILARLIRVSRSGSGQVIDPTATSGTAATDSRARGCELGSEVIPTKSVAHGVDLVADARGRGMAHTLPQSAVFEES